MAINLNYNTTASDNLTIDNTCYFLKNYEEYTVQSLSLEISELTDTQTSMYFVFFHFHYRNFKIIFL